MPDFTIIIPAGLYPPPEEHEVTAALLLAAYFGTDIYFIPRAHYLTPDFKINMGVEKSDRRRKAYDPA